MLMNKMRECAWSFYLRPELSSKPFHHPPCGLRSSSPLLFVLPSLSMVLFCNWPFLRNAGLIRAHLPRVAFPNQDLLHPCPSHCWPSLCMTLSCKGNCAHGVVSISSVYGSFFFVILLFCYFIILFILLFYLV